MFVGHSKHSSFIKIALLTDISVIKRDLKVIVFDISDITHSGILSNADISTRLKVRLRPQWK